MDELKEEWKDVVSFEGLYQVSNTGKVKSLNFNRFGYEQEMKQNKNHDGYYYLTLQKDGKSITRRVHRLVAEAFIPNPNCYLEVNHIDTDRTNNNVSNLEWCTHKDNVKHSYDLGHYVGKFGEDNPNYGNTKLSEFYKENPEISKEKQGRPAEQNGRATKIQLLDLDMNLIKEFSYIIPCCQYLIDIGATKSDKVESIRGRINDCIRKNKPYVNKYYFKKLN